MSTGKKVSIPRQSRGSCEIFVVFNLMQHLWSRFESVVEVELRFTHGAGKVLTPFQGPTAPAGGV